MFKRIILMLFGLLLSVYIVLELFLNGYFSPKKLIIENQQIDFPNNYMVFQANKEGKLYNLFEIPFLDFSFDPTTDFEDSGVSLENHETKDLFFLYFIKYSQKICKDYYHLLTKKNYNIKKVNSCNIAIKKDEKTKDYMDMYIYKSDILYHYMGGKNEADNLTKQLCLEHRS